LYSRPGIAYLLLEQISEAQLISRRPSFYTKNRFNLVYGRVTCLDINTQTAHLDNGQTLPYDVLLLATGARATPPSFPGSNLEGVVTLDTLDNAKKIVENGRKTKSAVVVGGGITAMELAEGLHHQGMQTHFLQRGSRLWPRLFDEHESGIVEHQIKQEGIHLHYHEEIVEAFGKNGRVEGVRLQSGKEIKCQMIGVAIGVKPNLELVKNLPVEQNQGILVTDYLQTNIPTLFAAGDVAQVYDRWTKKPQLDILWPSAIQTGRTAGRNMVEVANGRSPHHLYQKGSPFNAAMLFGIHLTVIGRIGTESGRNEGEVAEVSHLSRGASQVWTTPFQSNYRSAWDKKGTNSIRITMQERQIVGALLMGNQQLADPLRQLIENQVIIPSAEILLASNTHLPQTLLNTWAAWQRHSLSQAA
jgi:NAD(P)H-nitrite reductase large subunit